MGEYIGKDGFRHCDVCGEALETVVKIGQSTRKVNCICDCRRKALKAADEAGEKMRREKNREICFHGSAMTGCRFENSRNAEILAPARNYAEHFPKFKKNGKGILFWGTVGTGKSHAAACIANAVIDQGYKALMTNFATVVNRLSESWSVRAEYMDSLNRYALMIIDDLGAERDSSYMKEQVFNVIDARYRSGLPLIVTTNLSIDEIKSPADAENRRIYDRILERCHPVEAKGASLRRQKIRAEFEETERLLRGDKI